LEFDEAVTLTVEVYQDGSADFILESAAEELGVWEFAHFPGDDFSNRGLNIVGPWLNARGLGYLAWQEPNPGQYLPLFMCTSVRRSIRASSRADSRPRNHARELLLEAFTER
jgi:hypothetical protein